MPKRDGWHNAGHDNPESLKEPSRSRAVRHIGGASGSASAAAGSGKGSAATALAMLDVGASTGRWVSASSPESGGELSSQVTFGMITVPLFSEAGCGEGRGPLSCASLAARAGSERAAISGRVERMASMTARSSHRAGASPLRCARMSASSRASARAAPRYCAAISPRVFRKEGAAARARRRRGAKGLVYVLVRRAGRRGRGQGLVRHNAFPCGPVYQSAADSVSRERERCRPCPSCRLVLRRG